MHPQNVEWVEILMDGTILKHKPPYLLITFCNFQSLFLCTIFEYVFLGVSGKSFSLALLLIHISMFLAELGFLQKKKTLYPSYTLVVFCLDYGEFLPALIWLS